MNKSSFDELQKKYYKNAEVKRFFWQTQNPYIKKKEQELLSGLKALITPNAKILEVGSGEAANIVNLIDMGVDNPITAVDFSREKIEFCSELNLQKISFIQADIRQLPFKDNEYDIVFARDIFHHVDNDRMLVIKELYRVTNPQGYLIIIEPNYDKFINFVFTHLFRHEIGIKNSTKEKLSTLISEYNYKMRLIEPSNLFRLILHYNLGLPYLSKIDGFNKFLDIVEKVHEKLIKNKNWAYWFIVITKDS